MNVHRGIAIAVWVSSLALTFGLGAAISQQVPPSENKGVEVSQSESVDLGAEIGLQGFRLEMRKYTVEPGGVIRLHSHKDRPEAVYILQGTLTEYRDGAFFRMRPEGMMSTSGKDVTHWLENKGTVLAVFVAAGVFRSPLGR
jgi:quercetin dioxygenase-like cupin family protein